MPRALFTSKNLIGDALNVYPALAAWRAQHSEWAVDLLTLDGHAKCLYSGMGLDLNVITDMQACVESVERGPQVYDFQFVFDPGVAFAIGDAEKKHITECYAQMLNVQISSVALRYTAVAWTAEDVDFLRNLPEEVILLGMFSRSCASQQGKPPNKMIPFYKWKPILRYLRTLEIPLRVLGALGDVAPGLDFTAEEYLCGESLNRVALVMKEKAVLLVTIDNGMSHLGATQQVPTFLFYPACLGLHWIAPWGNPHLKVAHCDPAEVAPAAMLWALKQAVPKLLEVYKNKT
jgi:hypothetical protein